MAWCTRRADPIARVRRKRTTLKKYLNGFRNEAALAMNWVLVGPSHQNKRPPSGVLRGFTECVQKGSYMVKSIANTYYLANIADQPHVFEYRCARAAMAYACCRRVRPTTAELVHEHCVSRMCAFAVACVRTLCWLQGQSTDRRLSPSQAGVAHGLAEGVL